MIGGYEEELIKQMFDLALVILNLKKKKYYTSHKLEYLISRTCTIY